MDDFELAFELDARLSCGCGRVGGLRKTGRAAEEQEAGENRAAQDPRGTDLDLQWGTFLIAMIAKRIEQSEITGVQSQKNISEVQEP